MSRREAPNREVLCAFGLKGEPVPVGGGRGTTWQLGTAMLKPGVDPTFQEWLATLTGIEQVGFRLAEPLPARDGRWVVQGWGAQRVLSGTAPSGPHASWASVLGAARAFHEAVASMPRPAFLDDRTDAWAVADRATWAEVDIHLRPEALQLVRRLTPVARLTGDPQLVHGDLTGNVLLDALRVPGIIDVSPYWRPVHYAEGIVMADVLTWHHARSDLPAILGVPVEAVALGLLFRTHTATLLGGTARDDQATRQELISYAATADALGL